jgi:hypothetical protein
MAVGNTDSNNQVQPQPIRINSRQQAFFDSEVAAVAKTELKLMAKDPRYNTQGTFSAKYTGHVMPFVERHMKYLSEHPKLDAQHYLSNLKLMTKIKQ